MSVEARSQTGNQGSGPGGAPTLPVGGGAIRSIDQSFATNPATGTATMTIALPISPGRSGFTPDLALSYDSGNGNGPFGVGWRAEPASIGRRLDQRLPVYDDSDTYVLGGRDDLVPVLPANVTERGGHRVERFRSRTETAFERVERWTRLTDGDVHWRTLGIDDVTTLFGTTPASRVADPADPRRVVTWLPSARWDGRGNAMVFDYVADDDTGIDALAHERQRTPAQRAATRYLAAVRYGNRRPNLADDGTPFDPATLDDWLFSLVFDYGDVPTVESTDADGRQFTSIATADRLPGTWPMRADPFSTSRAGFEVRTSRLCRRVLMFHHLPDELGRRDTLVRSLRLTYDERPALTRLVAATELGHVARPTPTEPDRYLTAALPTVELTYSDVPDAATMSTLPVQRLDDAAASALVLDRTTTWVDLDGDGATGLLTDAGGALWYRRNTSPAAAVADVAATAVSLARFGPPERLDAAPWRSLHADGATLVDVDGDGQAADLAVLTGPSPGYARRVGRRWAAPGTFDGLPADALADPDVRWIDLDGDGRADLARSDGDALVWFASRGTAGFVEGGRVVSALPHLRADHTQAVLVADMTGDGLADLVRVRNGEVCYWPNLGYGRFGTKVTMSAAPRFAATGSFDPARVLAGDLDGSGTTDLVYADADGIAVHLNESGNAWAAPVALPQLPRVDAPGDVRVIDLLGTGTACVVVSGRRPDLADGPVGHVDVMGGVKPHLLVGATNGIGLRTTIEYAPSTAFAAADAAAGEPWLTTLPFPVHVVRRVITADEVTGSVLTSRFTYHDGCYDGVEREMRGFAMVERLDTETFATLDRLGRLQGSNVDRATAVPPTLTRCWFHTGVLAETASLEARYAAGAGSRSSYREPADRVDPAPALAALLPDTTIPEGLTAEEARQAVRALRAAPLREEVYGLDGVGSTADTPFGHPYVVTEHAHRLLCLQRADGLQPAVFHRHLRETLTTAYDRRPTDPRVTHQLTLDIDPASGQPLVEVAVAYPRRTQVRTVGGDRVVTTSANPDLAALDPQDRTAQTTTHLTWTAHRRADAVDEPDHQRAGLAAETTRWELTGFAPPGPRFAFDDIGALFAAAAVIDPVDEPDGTTPQRRIVQQQRTLYRTDDLTAFAALGTCGRRALPGMTLRLALTPSLLDAVLARRTDLLLADRSVLTSDAADGGGYVEAEGSWWIPSSRTFFDPAADPLDPGATAAAELAAAQGHFFVPRLTVDPFGKRTTVTLEPAELFAGEVVDALGNTVTATYDYRVLQPVSIVDANGNRSSVIHDALGFVAATALAGKDGAGVGDSLVGIDADVTPAQLRQAFADPLGAAPGLLGRATRRYVHDHDRFARGAGPTATIALARELHGHQPGGATSPVRVNVSHLDGNGRTVQEKAMAESGRAPQRDADTTTTAGDVLPGPLRRGAGGAPQLGDTDRRWVGSGRLVLNNKGKPVRRYDPFFSATALYEPERELTDTGTSSVLFYDPIERLVAGVHPEGTYDKVVHTPWRQLTYDVNDTVTTDPRADADIAAVVAGWAGGEGADWVTWLDQRNAGQLGPAEQQAAAQATAHADTPSFAHLDPLGRPFATIGMNRTTVNGAPVDQPVRVTVVFDALSNQREVLDGTDRVVTTYRYDLDGHRLHQSSLDAGDTWQLDDVLGNTVRSWDGRGVDRRFGYDELRRPTDLHVTADGVERVAERMEYGESVATAADDNLRLRLHRSCDAAGTVTFDVYDFTGHPVDTVRDLLTDHTTPVDWAADPPTDGGHFRVQRTFDALDRTIALVTPDGSVQRPVHNAAGLLESVTVDVRGGAPTTIVAGADYDERGRRRAMQLGNGATTTWTFDDTSHLLRTIRTVRPAAADATASTLFSDAAVVQDQRYTYDPSGNVTRIDDAAAATVINAGQVVSATRTFTYDAAYRLVAATGREHIAQTALDLAAAPGSWRDRPFAGAHPNDAQAMRNYTQTYAYDDAGNLATVRHLAAGAGWTRTYEYAPSRLQPARPGNRLARTTVGNDSEDYGYSDGSGVDADGCITRLGALPLTWDHAHRLVRADLGGGGTAWYAHDAAGQRVRTVIDAVAGGSRTERIVVDGFELIRTVAGPGATTAAREVLSVMADDARVAVVETVTVHGGAAVADPRPLVRHQLADHLGSSVAELDGGAALISVEEYHPFGTTSFQAGRSATEVNLRRYRFTGHERDAETGLVQCGVRSYVPWLGRWSSPDPLGVVDGTNGFVYARNNPLVFVDRAGTDVHKVVTTNNHRDLLRDAIGKVQSKTPTNESVDAQNKRIDLSKPPPKATDLSTDAQIEREYRNRIPLFGRITTKLSGFAPPGWEAAGGNEAACFKLACQGADKTAKPGETSTGGGGVILYEAVQKRIRTDKDASDLALAQIKRHVDAGRALVAGISEPAHSGQVDKDTQPVTDHFVDIYGYETDETGRVTGLFARDNAVGGTAEVRFNIAADGSITKPADTTRKDYIAAEYQLSEVRFHSGFEYTGALRPKNDADKLMVWPNPDPKPAPPPPKPKK